MPAPLEILTSFNAGEWSPNLYGRSDLQKFPNAQRLMLNALPMVQGGFYNRPGFDFIAEARSHDSFVRLMPFQFSIEQSYIIELGDGYARFYRDRGQLLSGGSPVEASSPWTSGQLPNIKFAQSADVIYVGHPDYPPQEIQRVSDTSWQIVDHDFLDGPYLDINPTLADSSPTTLQASAATGSVTITASAVTGINGGDGFKETDIGRHIRMKVGSNDWGWAIITAWTSTTVVTATVQSTLSSTSTTDQWHLGAWSDTTGWPHVPVLHQERLFWGATGEQPQRFWSSETNNFSNYQPSQLDDSVLDTDSIVAEIFGSDRGQVNGIRWMESTDKGLLIGTSSGEFVVRASVGTSITPSDRRVDRQSSHGSEDKSLPVRVDESVVFVQRARRRLQEVAFNFSSDQFVGTDLNKLADHLPAADITEVAYLKEPDSVIFATLSNGKLLSLTHKRQDDVVAWAQHTLGGGACVTGSGGNSAFDPTFADPDETVLYSIDDSGDARKYDKAGNVVWTSTPAGGLSAPESILYEPNSGKIYVTGNSGAATVLVHRLSDSDGTIEKTGTLAAQAQPKSLFVSENGQYIYNRNGPNNTTLRGVSKWRLDLGTPIYTLQAILGSGATASTREMYYHSNKIYLTQNDSSQAGAVWRFDVSSNRFEVANDTHHIIEDSDLTDTIADAVFADDNYVIVKLQNASHVGSGGKAYDLICYNATTDAVIWRRKVPNAQSITSFHGDPYDDDYIYGAGPNGSGYNFIKIQKSNGAAVHQSQTHGSAGMWISVGRKFIAHGAAGEINVFDKSDLNTAVLSTTAIGSGLESVDMLEVTSAESVVAINTALSGSADYCGPQVGSIASIPSPDGSRDQLWAVVKRRVNGELKQYVEAMADPHESGDDIADATYVDSATRLDSATDVTTVSGLGHLENELVSGLIDGAAFNNVRVASGAITLPFPGKKVVVGLPYLSDVTPVELLPRQAGDPRGKSRGLSKIKMRVLNTKGGKYSVNGTRFYAIDRRKDNDDEILPVFSGLTEIQGLGHVDDRNTVTIRQDEPYPMTVTQIVAEASVGGI